MHICGSNCRTVAILVGFAISITHFTSVPSASAEVYTALVDLEKLLYTEGQIIPVLDAYLQAQEWRLRKLRSRLGEYERMHAAASEDATRFLSNPINAYLLVKRLQTDWKEVQTLLTEESGRDLVENVTQREDLHFPEEEDLNGAAVALTRLQDTYLLDTAALARGEIQGVHYSAQLTAGDCFELGRQSYNNGDHYHTVLWMQEALDRYDEEFNKTARKSDILEYLAFSTFMQGNVRHAIKLTTELLEIVPDHPRARGNVAYYEASVAKSQRQQKRGDDGDVPVETLFTENLEPKEEELPERGLYEKLCRGEKLVSAKIESLLKCRLTTNNKPFFFLQPLKQEDVFLRPRITVYHDVMSDSEIAVIKHLATPRLRRATVQNYKSGELEVANYRISKSAWLKEDEDVVIPRINRRVQEITGLAVNTAEELQVVNYGIGGHYEPHFDFARREEKNAFKSLGTGNRIATFLFYMSDVEAGGATVFPHIGVALWPRKGSAAFWHNLHRSGDGDVLTRHAACPVLAGSKWVSNKWMHERGQEFRRRCGTRINDE